MAKPSQQNQPAVVEVVHEIMRIVRSLPPRPSIDEVDAAKVVVKSVKMEEQSKLEEILKQEKPPDVPEDLFFVLKEVKKNLVFLQSEEQRREALHVIELNKRLEVFDELIQRASNSVSGEEDKDEKDANLGLPAVSITEEKSFVTDGSFLIQKTEEEAKKEVPKLLLRSSSAKAGFSTGGDAQKLSLMNVASVIEASAKKGSGVLDLQGRLVDQVEWLPQSLGKLFAITELNLSENRLMVLPSTIANLKCLTKLDIHSNQIINLPDSFGELSSLIDLDLHANRLRSLPASIGNLVNLAYLDVSSNQISLLPETIGSLTNLKSLNIETNELEELPYTIGLCISLVELRLDFNQLKALPEALGKLENLELLTLHYNRVKGLPTTMGSLSKLRELDVSFNELESVPESLCFATSLVKLNIGRNFADLRSLPRSIGNLEMLEEIDISNNQIRFLPESFRFLSMLKVFHADETPLEVPPREIVKLGAQAVIQYMADLVAKKDAGPALIKKKGFWSWLRSLFQRRKKSKSVNTDILKP